MSKGYDPKCEELAEHFVAEVGGTPDELRSYAQDLAQVIQDAVENWFAGVKQ